MMGTVIAAWLICLTLSPFTAPFATCDLAVFVAESAARPRPLPISPASVTKSRTDAAISPIVTGRRADVRAKAVALFGHAAAHNGLNRRDALGARGASFDLATSPARQTVLRI